MTTRKVSTDQLAAWRRAAEAGDMFAADNVLLLLDDLDAADDRIRTLAWTLGDVKEGAHIIARERDRAEGILRAWATMAAETIGSPTDPEAEA